MDEQEDIPGSWGGRGSSVKRERKKEKEYLHDPRLVANAHGFRRNGHQSTPKSRLMRQHTVASNQIEHTTSSGSLQLM